MSFSVSVGPEPTERQAQQRDATERAAKVLRDAGIACKVVDLVCGPKFPNADSAMITITVEGGH